MQGRCQEGWKRMLTGWKRSNRSAHKLELRRPSCRISVPRQRDIGQGLTFLSHICASVSNPAKDPSRHILTV